MVAKTQAKLEHVDDQDHGLSYEKVKESKFAVKGNLEDLPLLQRINWVSSLIIFTPLITGVVGAFFVKPHFNTLILAVVMYFLCGFGITMGYHRYFSHKCFKAHPVVEFFLAIFGAAALEGSARWWCRNHRVHHRYVDSEKDPYAVHRGFWYAHWGWMVFKQDSRRYGRINIQDLNENKLLQFQHKHYLPIALGVSVAAPLLIASLWGDVLGAFVWAVMLRITFVHQATFCINSVAHYWGEQPFARTHSSFDSILCALMTMGEGYHNFHHEFPFDYRNAIKWYQYDPTKWLIKTLSFFGLTYDLEKTADNEIKKAQAQVLTETTNWGIQDAAELEDKWTLDRIKETAAKTGRMLFAVHDRVVELPPNFVETHPGGAAVLRFWAGKDITAAFDGTVYRHSKAARNQLCHVTIGHFVEGTKMEKMLTAAEYGARCEEKFQEELRKQNGVASDADTVATSDDNAATRKRK